MVLDFAVASVYIPRIYAVIAATPHHHDNQLTQQMYTCNRSHYTLANAHSLSSCKVHLDGNDRVRCRAVADYFFKLKKVKQRIMLETISNEARYKERITFRRWATFHAIIIATRSRSGHDIYINSLCIYNDSHGTRANGKRAISVHTDLLLYTFIVVQSFR